MRVALFATLMLPLASWAGDAPSLDCAPQLDGHLKAMEQVAGQTTTTSGIKGNCSLYYLADAEKEWQRVVPQEPDSTQLVGEKQLTGRPSEAVLLQKMIGSNPPNAFTNLPRTCTTVHCALITIFGSRESAFRALTIGHRDGYIISVDQEWREKHPKDYIWKENDLRQTELGMRMMPAPMRRMKSLETISRWPPGIKPAGYEDRANLPAAYASGRKNFIRLFEGTFSPGAGWARATLIHEIAHHLDFTCLHEHNETFHDRAGFTALSGWRTEKIRKPGKNGELEEVDEIKHHENANFPTDYASSEPWEDWAESVSYAITAPDYLKAVAPEKYEMVKTSLLGGKDPLGFGDPEILAMIPLSETLLQKCVSHWAPHTRIDIPTKIPTLAEKCSSLPPATELLCDDRDRRFLHEWTRDHIDRIPANKKIQESVEAAISEAKRELPRLKLNCEQARTRDEACLRREVGKLMRDGHLSNMPRLAEELARSLDVKPAVKPWRKP